MTIYTCPLCKAKYKRFKWFVKHINKYSEEDRQKIFVNNGKLLFQGDLSKYLKSLREDE